MEHRRIHWLEKLQVQLAVTLAASLAYFLLGPTIHLSDPEMPLSLLPTSNSGVLPYFALMAFGLAVLVGLLTVSARPGAAVMGAMFAVGGLVLGSNSFRPLLWLRQTDHSLMYYQLWAELLMLTIIAIVAGMLALLGRAVIGSMRPRWLWQDPLAIANTSPGPGPGGLANRVFRIAFCGLADYAVLTKDDVSGKVSAKPMTLKVIVSRTASCLLLSMVVAGAALMVLTQSDDRGQIIFAVLVSFLLGALAAHQAIPCPYPVVAWVGPLVVGSVFYILAATNQIGPYPQSWMQVALYSRVLPADWITFGIGGGLLGYWFSARMHENKHLEAKEE